MVPRIHVTSHFDAISTDTSNIGTPPCLQSTHQNPNESPVLTCSSPALSLCVTSIIISIIQSTSLDSAASRCDCFKSCDTPSRRGAWHHSAVPSCPFRLIWNIHSRRTWWVPLVILKGFFGSKRLSVYPSFRFRHPFLSSSYLCSTVVLCTTTARCWPQIMTSIESTVAALTPANVFAIFVWFLCACCLSVMKILARWKEEDKRAEVRELCFFYHITTCFNQTSTSQSPRTRQYMFVNYLTTSVIDPFADAQRRKRSVGAVTRRRSSQVNGRWWRWWRWWWRRWWRWWWYHHHHHHYYHHHHHHHHDDGDDTTNDSVTQSIF